MRFLSIDEVIELHARVVEQSGGSSGLRDRGGLESSVAQPHQSFGGAELYPTIVDKAAALGFFLIANHPFIDGNKRIGHAALEVTLVLNGLELNAHPGRRVRANGTRSVYLLGSRARAWCAVQLRVGADERPFVGPALKRLRPRDIAVVVVLVRNRIQDIRRVLPQISATLKVIERGQIVRIAA